MPKPYVAFALVMALMAGGLRLWSDVDEATLFQRYDFPVRDGRVWYRPLGRTLGMALNMPVASLCYRTFPSALPRFDIQRAEWQTWAKEAAIVGTQAGLTGLFWTLLGLGLLRMRRQRARYRLGLFAVDIVAALALALVAAAAATASVSWFRQFMWVEPTPSQWILYIKRTRFTDELLVDSFVCLAMGMWCIAGVVVLVRCAVRQTKALSGRRPASLA